MDRRNFLRSMLGVAAATALPSEVWPFRKIFLPPAPMITRVDVLDLNYWGQNQIRIADVTRLQMGYYANELAPFLAGTYPALVGPNIPLHSARLERQLDEWFPPEDHRYVDIVSKPPRDLA